MRFQFDLGTRNTKSGFAIRAKAPPRTIPHASLNRFNGDQGESSAQLSDTVKVFSNSLVFALVSRSTFPNVPETHGSCRKIRPCEQGRREFCLGTFLTRLQKLVKSRWSRCPLEKDDFRAAGQDFIYFQHLSSSNIPSSNIPLVISFSNRVSERPQNDEM